MALKLTSTKYIPHRVRRRRQPYPGLVEAAGPLDVVAQQ